MTDLGALGRDSEAWAINNSGQVVGSTDNGANYASHAFLYTPGTGMVDLNTVLPNGSGWTLNIATGINDNGQITGWATNANGVQHAFLLSPLNPLQVLVNALTAAINQLSLNSQAKALLLQYVNQLPTTIAQLTSAQKTHLIRQLTALESIVHGMVTGKRITAAQRTQLITLINDFIAALRA
jgi:probable HAF family extracellular repeat protein